MKTLSRISLLSVAFAMVSCTQTPVVQVIDSKTKMPVAGAAVTSTSGEYYTGAAVTDYNGMAVQPEMPGGADAIAVRRPGYSSRKVSVY